MVDTTDGEHKSPNNGLKVDTDCYSSSSPDMPVLSSSTSTSSISSVGSSGESTKPKGNSKQLQASQNATNNVNKPYYMQATAQREDSGIFASDDTSTSEFSQSPSPELIITSDINHLEKVMLLMLVLALILLVSSYGRLMKRQQTSSRFQ